jgi:alkylation response protein AidB-like acyl-CoA dehydrogenase
MEAGDVSRMAPRTTGTAASALERARALLPTISEAGARIESERELPPELLAALHEARLFRLALPRALGGEELPPAEIAQITEAVAAADASTAWCLGQGNGCAMAAAFLDEPPARQVFGPGDAVLAWGAGAQGRAVACDGGYRVSGRWGFASGSRHATWLGGHCRVLEADGSPRLGVDGAPVLRTALFPRERARVADDWHVVGLRGTRSEGYAVEDLFVEQALTLDRDTPSECRVDTALYRFTTTQVYASAFSGVALGIARALLDALTTLAREKTPRGAGAMRDSPVVQTRLAELEAQWGAARAFQQQTLRDAWARVEGGAELGMDERVRIRLATTWAINQATEVSEQVWRLAGAIAAGAGSLHQLRDRGALAAGPRGRHAVPLRRPRPSVSV